MEQFIAMSQPSVLFDKVSGAGNFRWALGRHNLFGLAMYKGNKHDLCSVMLTQLRKKMTRDMGIFSQIKISRPRIVMRATISNYIYVNHWDVITLPCTSFSNGLKIRAWVSYCMTYKILFALLCTNQLRNSTHVGTKNVLTLGNFMYVVEK